jgi:O-methyltransferase involved in polyketide biosynthesis
MTMSETTDQTLSDVSETLLITLYIRAMETSRPDPLIKDEKAVELVRRMSRDFDRIRQIPMGEFNKLVIVLRNREFDRYARDFMARYPEAVVVHIGCGLDSRFERVDNGRVEWCDLDLPHVIELRRKFIGGEGERHHLLSCSVLDNTWLDMVSAHRQRPFLFLAEGVFTYFEEAQVKSLVLTLRDRFPGAELVFDTHSPFFIQVGNIRFATSTKLSARLTWGIWRGQEIEAWGNGIRLLDEWGFFDSPEPRLDHMRWMRPIEARARTLRIYHFQLGEAARSGLSYSEIQAPVSGKGINK